MSGKIAAFIYTLIANAFLSVEASSPVVLWTLKRIGEGHVESNLNEFTPTQFADLVAWKSEHGNIPVIAFGLNSLSLEDLTPQGGVATAEPFRKLKSITDASAETLLFPAVQSASDAISVLQRKGFEVIQINAGDPLPKIDSPSTILVVMDKASVNMDDEILRVFKKYTLDFPNLVGMLWGKQSTWSEEPEDDANEILRRKKRQAENNETDIYSFNDSKGLFLVFREVVLVIHRKERKAVNFKKAQSATTNTTVADTTVLTLAFPNSAQNVSTEKFEIVMTLKKGKLGYWKMTNATATLIGNDNKAFEFNEVQLSSAVDLTVPTTLSFHCSKFGSLYPVKKMEDLKQNLTFTIDFKGFQIQAFMPHPESDQNVFVSEYECVGFFTPGIWSGIFVTIILISILSWGMKMIMDVRTMDRFDDPKGKPISFGSGE